MVSLLSISQIRSQTYFAERQDNDLPQKINTGKDSNYYLPETNISEITI